MINRYSYFTKIFLIVLLLSASLNARERKLPFTFTPLKKPVKAPITKLPSSLDKIISIDDYKGKIIVLNFWATWCPPCRLEMPSLQRFSVKVKKHDIVVLAIATGQNDDDVFPFMSEITPRATFPILYDKSSQVSAMWGIRAMPTTFIIDKKGFVTHYAMGARDFDNPKFLNMLLKK